jgi:hypothetical protein
MDNADPQSIFRGLPLSSEQDAEIRHYIKQKKQHGVQWDTPELEAMLLPPNIDDEEFGAAANETKSALVKIGKSDRLKWRSNQSGGQ